MLVTYPQELRENTNLKDTHYPMNLFRNRFSSLQKGTVILSMHWHEHLEIIMVISGHTVFHIDSKSYEAFPGDILLVPPGGLHVGYSISEEKVEYVALVFNSSLLTSCSIHDRSQLEYIMPYLEGSLQFQVKLCHTDHNNDMYRSLLQQMINEFETKARGYELIVKSQLYVLFTLLSRQYMPERRPEKPSISLSRNLDRFKELLLYIEHHFTENVTVEQAAKRVNLNPYHFCKTFKKTTGCTWIEYVNLMRMNKAMKLLTDSDLTITEIAGLVGCGNPNYFTKMFKKYKGAAPSQLRKDKEDRTNLGQS
jgi:AraC family transcriptional activator of pobA